jgi:hypothetical protein
MDMEALDAALKRAGGSYSTRTVRGALAELRKRGHVHSAAGRHTLTPAGRQHLTTLSDGLSDAA